MYCSADSRDRADKRTNQQAVCKIAVFAYDRMSGQPVWQSGNRKVASKAKDSWFSAPAHSKRERSTTAPPSPARNCGAVLERRRPRTAGRRPGAELPRSAPQYAAPERRHGRIASLPPPATEGGRRREQAGCSSRHDNQPAQTGVHAATGRQPPPAKPAPGLQGHLMPQSIQLPSIRQSPPPAPSRPITWPANSRRTAAINVAIGDGRGLSPHRAQTTADRRSEGL